MTQTFGTNSRNDIYRGSDGNLVVLTGINAVMAACKTAAQAQLKEMVLAQKSGIPNFDTVWKGAPNYPLYESYLRNTLQSVKGVIKVTALTISPSNGILSYTATIETIDGTQELQG